MGRFHLAERPCVAEAIEAAAACTTLDELATAVKDYRGDAFARDNPFTPSFPARITTGNPIMIVAEKPEPEDVEAGAAFSGAYGAVMREVLSWTGLDMDRIHVAYAVHWMPPEDKSLNATQISIGRPFLSREIEIVRPRAILMPGRGVYEALFNRRDPITPLLGATMNWREGGCDIPCRLVVHPKFAGREKTQIPEYGRHIQDFVDDYARIDEIDTRGALRRWGRAA